MGKMDEFLQKSKVPLHEEWGQKRKVVFYVREILKSLIAHVKNAYFPFFDEFSFDNRAIRKNNVKAGF